MSIIPTRSHNTARPWPLGRRARVDAAVRTGAWTVLGLSLLLVTWWWVTAGGPGELTAWQTAPAALGRLTALLAADLLLAQMFMIARVPVLEAAFGLNRLVRHRGIALTAVILVIVHVLLSSLGHADNRPGGTPAAFWELATRYPGMPLAVAGTAGLVLVVLTSLAAWRHRLRYESWHLLHLYAYLGVGLALPHQLWTGRELLISPAATAYWWTVWAMAAGSVLVWRVGLPLWRSARHRVRVDSVTPENDRVVSVHMTGRDLDRLPVLAGQYCNWRFLGGPGRSRGHPFALSAAPDGRSLRITVKVVGDGTARVRELRPGTAVLFEGPYGRLTEAARSRSRVALFGAGIGVAPMRALAEGLDYAPGDAVLLQRCAGRPLFEDELAALAKERGLRVLRLTGEPRRPGSWLGDEPRTAHDDVSALRSLVPDIADRDVYICGPQEWTRLVRRAARAAGVPARRIHIEDFDW